MGLRPCGSGIWAVFPAAGFAFALGLLWIAKLIIDGIVRAVSTHQPVQPGFWWLVAAEFGLAVLSSVLSRTIDYLDALLATSTPATSASR